MNDPKPIDISNAISPGLPRRLAAIVYDSFLVAGLLLLAGALAMLLAASIGGKESALHVSENILFKLWIALPPLLFFIGFWTHGGQTLGMRAWKIMVIRRDGMPLNLKNALIRLFCAILSWLPMGLGFLWMLGDRDGLTWHDRLSGTQLVMLEKNSAKK